MKSDSLEKDSLVEAEVEADATSLLLLAKVMCQNAEGEKLRQLGDAIAKILYSARSAIKRSNPESLHPPKQLKPVSNEPLDLKGAQAEFEEIFKICEVREDELVLRNLRVLRAFVFERKTKEQIMLEFGLTIHGVKVSKKRGIDFIWQFASPDLRNVILRILQLARSIVHQKVTPKSPQTPPSL